MELDAGHAAPLTRPQAVADLLLEILNEPGAEDAPGSGRRAWVRPG